VVAALGFIVRRGQDQNFDLLNYHYFAGYSALAGRSGDVAAMGLPSFFNPVASVPAYLSFANLAYPWSALMLGALQLAVVPFVVLVQRELCGDAPHRRSDAEAVAALVIGLASPLWLSELGTSFYSSTTATLVVAAVWLILRALRSRRHAATWLVPAGALLGVATGLKLTNAIYVPAAVCAAIVACRSHRPLVAIASCAWLVAGAVAGFALAGGWYVELAHAYRSPLFPLFNRWFESPYAPPIDVRDARWAFGSIADAIRFVFAAPFGTRATSEVAFADARFALALLLAMAVAATSWWRRRRAAAATADARGSVVLAFVAASFVAWSIALAYQRYFITGELLLGSTICVLVDRMGLRRPWRIAMLGAALVVTLACVRVPDWVHVAPRQGGNVFGLRVPRALASEAADYLVAGAPVSFALAFLQPDSRFVRIDFIPELDPLVASAIAGFRARPVRLLATEEALPQALQRASRWGYATGREPCREMPAALLRLRVCELVARGQVL
jgi:hypothetical protein